MKKIFALILVCLLLATGCNNNASADIKNNNDYKKLEAENEELKKQVEGLKDQINYLLNEETNNTDDTSTVNNNDSPEKEHKKTQEKIHIISMN
ncbi:hypothetical protein ACKA01_06170 [Helcococcus kunzii]|uniref:Lipoprotein n=1 Tax=Helcococcus kunzii ATCC 51366 TaxID=883114 RepID=H3NM71_9FIRM|nr:hypothetical protein [Helcococcus kunzii]EHR35480.1 hypothetical protein HMPREF9709_00432 [Helcococcus kunzii ATCC 51366]QUY64386.1 hypothetical protein GUI37_02250 [Helcococcus kunzii]